MSKQPTRTMPKTKTTSKTTSKSESKTVSTTASTTASTILTMQDRIVELRTRREEVIAGGGEKRHAKQHAAGKLTARERIAELVDPLSWRQSVPLLPATPPRALCAARSSMRSPSTARRTPLP